MDEIVKQAMAKWPNVPDCYGWLGLDVRGNWYMRDDRVQSLGSFGAGPRAAKGSLLTHEKLIGFIHRNYGPDPDGQWYFQNGPQRVYVELELTPWIWRLQSDCTVQSHTGQSTLANTCLVDELGWVYLVTALGIGLVHTQDVALAEQALSDGNWGLTPIQRKDLPRQFCYVQSPQSRLNSL
jgi:hypothetical protein